MRQILPGVFHWTAIHPKIHIEVSSYWLEDGGVLIDPLVPPDVGLDWFGQRSAAPAAIVLSNRHHYRESARFAQRFGCAVHCNRAGLHEFTHGERVEAFDPGDRLAGGIVAYEIGGICPDDTALYLPAQRALSFADGLVRGGLDGQGAGAGGAQSGAGDEEGGALGFVPDVLMDDPPETKRLLLASFERALAELQFEHVLLAHGWPLVGNGRAALEQLVRRSGRAAFKRT
jgi:glyoxylase-like metal-dependent hydrolase (beta-lactamase superfamily II)